MKLNNILVPLDGSELAEVSLPVALDLAKDNPGATIFLLRAAAASTAIGAEPTQAQANVVREAEIYLQGIEARLVTQGARDVETSVWYGLPAPAIVAAAYFSKADLIVMSTHGRSGLGRLILGSVAEAVLRGTRTPILLLRADGAPVARPAGDAAPHPMKRPNKEAIHV